MQLDKEEILVEYNTYIGSLPDGLSKLLQSIEDEQVDKLKSQIVLFVEGLQWLLSASNYLKKQGVKLDTDLDVLNNHLKILIEGLEKQDYVLMSDIIEYELIPYFENLKVEN